MSVSTARHRSERAADRRSRAALIAIALLTLLTVAVFAKDNPFAAKHELTARFASSVGLRDGSAVRIAGIDVGRVTGIEPGARDSSLVTMEFDEEALPIHADARMAIEPRLALEGNFYVKVEPGSPGSPELESSGEVPIAQTDIPVQLDQALNVFNSPSRKSLQTIFDQFGKGLGAGGDGRTGSDHLRRAVAELDRSLETIGSVAAAARGEQKGDLAAALGSGGEVAEQLVADPAQLAGLMSSYARVSSALAARDAELSALIAGFDETFAVAPVTLPKLDSALDELIAFTPDLRDALSRAPATLAATAGLLDQVDGLVSTAELPRLLDRLGPTTRTLPAFLSRLEALAPGVTDGGECLHRTLVPAISQIVPDTNLTTEYPAWLELMHAGASTGSSSGGFDGNGNFLRLGLTFGEQTFVGNIPHLGELEASIPVNSSMNPEWLGTNVKPPIRPSERCADQEQPDLSLRGGKRPFDWMTPKGTPALTAGGDRRARNAIDRILNGLDLDLAGGGGQ